MRVKVNVEVSLARGFGNDLDDEYCFGRVPCVGEYIRIDEAYFEVMSVTHYADDKENVNNEEPVATVVVK